SFQYIDHRCGILALLLHHGQNLLLGHCLIEFSSRPSCRRNGAPTSDPKLVSLLWTHAPVSSFACFIFCKIRVALAPPNPNELVSTQSKVASRGSRTTSKVQTSSSSSMVVVGGTKPSFIAITQIAVSTAPAPPSRCPMDALVLLTMTLAASSPAHRWMAM